jgi:hypothetical protein
MTTELEVSWTQEMATAAARAQQRPVQTSTPRAQSTNDIVAACIEEHPSITIRRIHEVTGIALGDVNGACYSLLKQGRVERSHRQQDDRTKPVQWRVRS